MLLTKEYLEINTRNMGTIIFLTWMTLVWLWVVKNFERKITLQIQFRGRSTNWRIWEEHKATTLTQVPQGTSLSTICNLNGRRAGSGSHRSPLTQEPSYLPLYLSPRVSRLAGISSFTWDIQRPRFSINEYVPAICIQTGTTICIWMNAVADHFPKAFTDLWV